jgi:cellulose synthase operon protein C
MINCSFRMVGILCMTLIVFDTAAYKSYGSSENDDQQKQDAALLLKKAEHAKQQAEKTHLEKKVDEEEAAQQERIDSLASYIELKPDDLDVREELGILRADRVQDAKSYGSAYSILDGVVREDPKRNKARRKLIELTMLAGRYEDARNHLEMFLLKDKPDDPELLDLLGQCQEKLNEFDKAIESYNKAIKGSPARIDAYQRLAILLRNRMNKPKQAYDCMQNMIKNNSDSAKAYLCLGNYWQSINTKEEAKKAAEKDVDPKAEAMKAAEKAVQLSPDDQDALLLAAQCSMALDKSDQARNYSEHNLEVHKDSPVLYTTLAEIIVRAGDKKKAIEVLDEGLKETKYSPQILWYKANFLIDLRKIDDAREAIGQLQTAQYYKPLIGYLEARLAFAQKDWAEAVRLFEKVRPSLTTMPSLLKQADLSIGYGYGQLHNVDQEIIAYQRVLAADPSCSPARQGLTDALLASGRVDEAVQAYETIPKRGNWPRDGLIPYANLLIRQNLQRSANERNWDQVEKVLDEAEKTDPDSYQLPMLRAEMLHAQNRDQEAEKLLREVLAKKPAQIEYWKAIINLLALQKKWDQAEKILVDYEKQLGDSADLRLARCEYLLQRYDAKAAEYLPKLGENIDNYSDADKIRLWNGLLTAARRINNNDLIREFTDLLSRKDANNLEVQFLRLEQAANSQDLAALEDALKDVKKAEGEGPLWLFGQARLLAVRATKENNPALYDEALQYLAKAHELRPSWSRISLFMGTIYDQQNKPDQAVKCYTDAIDMGERNPAAVRRTVQILIQQQRYADADKILRQLDRQQFPFTPELTRLWVQLLFQQGEFDQGVAKARQVVSEKSDDYQEQMWLGQIFGVAARRAKEQKNNKDFLTLSAEAEKSLRRAVKLKNDVPETWIALVDLLRLSHRSGDAEAALDQAAHTIPTGQAPLILAKCYETIGRNDKAQDQYKIALGAKPDDPSVNNSVAEFYQKVGKPAEAEEILKRIVAGKIKAGEADLIQARRLLAKNILAKGGPKNIDIARNLIEQNLASAGNSVDDLRIKAQILSLSANHACKDEAILAYSKIAEGQQAAPDDIFNLAILYLAKEKQYQETSRPSGNAVNRDSDEWNKAKKLFQRLESIQSNDPRFMALYANASLEHGDVSNAELYVNKLAKDFSNAAATLTLQAKLLFQRKQYKEALDLLNKFVDQSNAIPPERSKRLRMMAEEIEYLASRLNDPDQKSMADLYIRTAEKLYSQYIAESPSKSLDLAAFLNRQGKTEKAVNALEQTWKNSEPGNIAQVSLAIAHNGRGDKDIVDRVEKVLNEARMFRIFKDHPVILMALGDLCSGQDRLEEAESFYREALRRNANYYVAMNNLAVLLSLRGEKLDEALTHINKALELAGPLGSLLDTRACVYIAKGDANNALADAEKAIADNPSAVRLFHQAQAFLLAGQKSKAASAMQKALKTGLAKDNMDTPEIPRFEELKTLAKDPNAPADK